MPPKPPPPTDRPTNRPTNKPPGAAKGSDPRRRIDVHAQHEEVRRQAMADLVKASRSGGLFSITQLLGSDERQDIMANGENAEAWKKFQQRSSQGWAPVLGPLIFFLTVIVLIAIVLLLALK